MKFYPLLIVLMGVFYTQASAQLCSGSLGDPVINKTFGSGTAAIGPSLNDTTSYTYIADPCPNDGFYTLAHSVGSCFNEAWHHLSQDHTGDPNGYMMIVNASPAPGVFFTYPIHGLCNSTTYEFSAWIVNLIKPDQCNGNPKLPNIAFTIETTAGVQLASYSTGNIPTTTSPQWNQYSLDFRTPAGVTDIVLKMSNANTIPGTCGNDLAIDDIVFRPCGPIVNANFSSNGSSVPSQLCLGYTGSFNIGATVDASTYTNPAYQWQVNTGSGWTDIPGATQTQYTVSYVNAQLGTYQYRLLVAEAININTPTCRVNSNVLTVTVNPIPTATASAANSKVCYADTIKLMSSGGATYQWTGPNSYTSNAQNPVIANVTQAMAGTYTVKAIAASGCFGTAQVTVGVYPKFIVSAGKDTTICNGQSVTLHATGGLSYSWSPGKTLSDSTSANPVASPTDTTMYVVTGTSANGCTSKGMVTIGVPKAPTANAGVDKYVFLGQTVQLNGTATGSNLKYRWTPATALNNATILTPIAKPTDDITYTLTVSDSCNTVSDDVFVKVYKQVVIPNAFSPNGDGINDTWNIDALRAFPQCVITVYNRDGQMLYHDVGYTRAWDGKYRNTPLPLGTYYYIIELKSQLPDMSGSVTIIR
ncbi:gliding motility-associated C-terminal domain-containing protein [Mucilaginibacter sp. AW1-3]